jgi:hypothetical protein
MQFYFYSFFYRYLWYIYIYTYLSVDEVTNTTKIYTHNFEILNLNLNESVQSNNIGIDSWTRIDDL